jgi:hypothetical protein
MSILISVSGFLFFLILALNVAISTIGKGVKLEGYDVEAELHQIHAAPARFRAGTVLSLLEHGSIILLALTLFLAFNAYSLALAVVWTVFRASEGLTFIYKTLRFRAIAGVAGQYAAAGDAQKETLRAQALEMFRLRDRRYDLALILWSIGTLAYSVLFVMQGIVPTFIGWLGIVSAVSVGIGALIKLFKPDVHPAAMLGGLLAMVFEVLAGGWLLLSPLLA